MVLLMIHEKLKIVKSNKSIKYLNIDKNIDMEMEF